MTLSVKERMILLSVLPREGDITTIRIVQNLRAALSFSEEEHARLGIKTVEDTITWNPAVKQDSEIEIGPKAAVLIEQTLRELSKAKKITADFLTVWDKFCPEKE